MRLLAIVAAVFTLAYCLAQLATGYTYMPAKRGGILLSGMPTVLIALSALLFCITAVSVVVDHYDERDNERLYKNARSWMSKTAFALLFFAPILELILGLLRVANGRELFRYRGFAADVTLYSPALAQYRGDIESIAQSSLFSSLFVIAFVFGMLSALAIKFRIRGMATFNAVAGIAFLSMVSVMLLLSVADSFVSGEASTGRRGRVYTALEDPAQFNAILLTEGLTGFLTLMFCAAAVLVMVKRGAGAFMSDQVRKR